MIDPVRGAGSRPPLFGIPRSPSGFEPIDEPADVPPPPPLGAPGPPISSTDAIARYILPVDQEDVSGTDLYA